MNLDEMLGFDSEDPADRHAEILVDEHEKELAQLVALRQRKGLSQEHVARIMGIDPSGISKIESGDRDLHRSTLRRYAFAVGGVIRHEVEDFDTVWRRERAAGVPAGLASMAPWFSLDEAVSADNASATKRIAKLTR
jgi:transcriptional regulator with XRE-family HTH domain